MRDADPTPEEFERGRLAVAKTMLKLGLPLTKEEQQRLA